MDRFLNKVRKTDTCWLWIGALNSKGYGVISWFGKNKYAHRVSFEFFNSEIEIGMVIDHICRNRRCVNPKHLRMVTSKENTLALGSISPANLNRLKIYCINGHPLPIKNKNGHRKCLICGNKSNNARKPKDRDSYLKSQLKYNESHREERRLLARKWRIKNRDKKLEYDRNYKKTHQ